jgi:hypothetical protein
LFASFPKYAGEGGRQCRPVGVGYLQIGHENELNFSSIEHILNIENMRKDADLDEYSRSFIAKKHSSIFV